ncbi:DNA repair protein RecN [Eubacterium ventriosum]|jgi:DNA repair protein RecN (Recombination protein N)|uniref:DNA repair protein RecN n=1 Tax=Eubacterium ventriosum TaxID=39496 RepID=UPI00210A45CF|nr:DNA repair protein RecN [Eubacterium ventriosum]MCQ5338553.1 DNA repair protein RecN [Eubacterium ventriosum]MEE0853930.1 DNA repair protein RecN [Eubacterium ventriosum]
MLLNLHVKNLALIEEVDVDFEKGLIVLTGETGAGKSLILGSVNIALGNKASKDMIRKGTDYSLVELTFSVSENCAKQLKKYDIYMEEDNIITVTRKISEGRSISKINGETVNIKTLKNVMSLLIDIHGQHDHQSLLYTKNHLDILDKFAKDSILELKEQIKEEYSKYTKLIKKLEEFNIDEGQKAREIEFAEYEVNEIESANLKPEEDVQVEEEFKKLSNSKEIVSALSEIYNALSYETAGGLGDIINKAVMDINSIKGMDEKISQFQTELYDIDNLCRELTSQIYDYNSGMDFNPEYVREVEERLDVINHLKLKYGNNIEEILRYKEEKEEYLEKLNNMTDEMESVKNQISELEGTLNNLCTKLSEQRKKAAKELEVLVKQALVDLNFIAVEFEIQITRKESIGENGFDNVEFMISTNPGESVKPLVKVASGGELSRIMLAIKSILATEDDIDTLIFDEIDTGISGQTAMKVAEKMAKISRNHQVICISHLSQIAAMADSHYLIKKTADENSTTTSIKKLTRRQSIEELVRINGGTGITEAGLIHATEMKDMADRTKSNLF